MMAQSRHFAEQPVADGRVSAHRRTRDDLLGVRARQVTVAG
jgi:hypothetical protein